MAMVQIRNVPDDLHRKLKAVLISRQGHRIILEPERRLWSPEFLALAGSAPYPDEPPEAEDGPHCD